MLHRFLDRELGHGDPGHSVVATLPTLVQAIADDRDRIEQWGEAEVERVVVAELEVERGAIVDLDRQPVRLKPVPE